MNNSDLTIDKGQSINNISQICTAMNYVK